MELKLYWTEFSKNELEKIFEYYKNKVGITQAKKLINEIYIETLELKKQPKIGQVEEQLKDRNQEFRYLVIKNYKIIYWINEEKMQIEIFDVFDTRQNPIKIKRLK